MTMMRPISSAILLSTLLLGFACATSNVSESALSPSFLNANAGQYDKQLVIVSGWLDYGFEKRHLFDDALATGKAGAGSGQFNQRCVSIEVPGRLRRKFERLNHEVVIVRGRFLADLAGDDVFLGMCNVTGLQVEDVSRVAR